VSYGIIVWGNSSYSMKIFTLQKRIIRIMMVAHPRTSGRKLLKKLEILTVPSQYTGCPRRNVPDFGGGSLF